MVIKGIHTERMMDCLYKYTRLMLYTDCGPQKCVALS